MPADERWFGLDRRTIRPTLAVFALAILMSVVLPVIDATPPYHDIVRAGDVLELEGNVTFVPEAGWGITSGLRAGHAPLSGEYPASATVEDGAMNSLCAPDYSTETPANYSTRSRQPPKP